MRQIVTTGIVLKRTNFAEADRILTVLTPDQGKIRLIAKGVRRIKSKLAGGVELFSVSDLTYIPGRGEVCTLVSSRLRQHFSAIVKELPRTMLGYELLKRIDRATEDATEPAYFELLSAALVALDQGLAVELLELWFDAQLLRLAGHQPNLTTDAAGVTLQADQAYGFDFDNMTFVAAKQGGYQAAHIKLLRLVFGLRDPLQLANIRQAGQLQAACTQLIGTARRALIRN